MNKAIFLDRDGVIIKDKKYISKPEQVELFPETCNALHALQSHGYKLVVVSNQSGLARGYFTIDDYNKVTKRMEELLQRCSVKLDLILYSPYLKNGKVKEFAVDSNCRKPGTGMFLEAQSKLQIDLTSSWMIGDKKSDIEAGKKLNLKTVFIKGLYPYNDADADFVCNNLLEASDIILNYN